MSRLGFIPLLVFLVLATPGPVMAEDEETLIGVWVGSFGPHLVEMSFQADGTFLSVSTNEQGSYSTQGQYLVDGSQLTMTSASGEIVQMTFEVSEDQILMRTDSTEFVFRRKL